MFVLLWNRLRSARNAAGTNQAAWNQVLSDAVELKDNNDMAKETNGGMSHPQFLVASNLMHRYPIVTFEPSPAEVILGRFISQREVWALRRNEPPPGH